MAATEPLSPDRNGVVARGWGRPPSHEVQVEVSDEILGTVTHGSDEVFAICKPRGARAEKVPAQRHNRTFAL
jgi:hypothetical protein